MKSVLAVVVLALFLELTSSLPVESCAPEWEKETLQIFGGWRYDYKSSEEEECAEICSQDPDCLGFDHVPIWQRCYFWKPLEDESLKETIRVIRVTVDRRGPECSPAGSESRDKSPNSEDDSSDEGGDSSDEGGESSDEGGESSNEGGEPSDDGGESSDEDDESSDESRNTRKTKQKSVKFYRKCSKYEFKCSNKFGNCIPTDYLCDNFSDCFDNSDERNCFHGSNKVTTDRRPLYPQTTMSDDEDITTNHRTYHETTADDYYTDDRQHTTKGPWDDTTESYQNDQQHTTKGPWDDTTESSQKCSPDQFQCLTKDGRNCVPWRWRCDRDKDCLDNSDEQDCGHYFGFGNHYGKQKRLYRKIKKVTA